MKISKIQNLFYQNKINPLNFNSRKITKNGATPIQDTFEKNNNTIKVIYDKNGNITDKIYFNRGRKFSACKYNGNGELIQTEFYEQDNKNRRYEVTKWDSTNLFSIERNHNESWKDYPSISLTIKNQKEFVRVEAQLPHSKMPIGGFHVARLSTTKRPLYLHIDLNGEYSSNIYSKEELEVFISKLEKLKETMQSEEYKKDFGLNKKLNKALDSAIAHLASSL